MLEVSGFQWVLFSGRQKPEVATRFLQPNLPGHGIVGQMHVGLRKHWILRLRVGEGMAKTQEVLLRMEKNLANRGVEVVLADIHILQVNL